MDFKEKLALVCSIAALVSCIGCGIMTAIMPFQIINIVMTGILLLVDVIAWVCFVSLKNRTKK